MAHFAELDENNTVIRVLKTDNDYPNEGYDWLIETFGGRWVQTSYMAAFRKNFAGIGCKYDEERDAFIMPKPFESWVLDEGTCQWIAPISKPDTEKLYNWDEETTTWIEAIEDELD